MVLVPMNPASTLLDDVRQLPAVHRKLSMHLEIPGPLKPTDITIPNVADSKTKAPI